MFDIWHDATHTFASQIGLSVEAMERAHGIVLGALGSTWVLEQASRTVLPGRGLSDVHPLYRSLTSSTLESILEVCEVAGYLLELRGNRGLNDVLVGLRDRGKYESTLFELAITWRLINAGLSVTMYPPTPNGRVADLAFEAGNSTIVAELSVFPSDVFARPAMVALRVISDTLSHSKRRSALSHLISVEVIVEDETEGNFQQDLASAVAGAIRDFASAQGDPTTVRTAFGQVFVRPTRIGEGPYEGNGGLSSCLVSVPRPAIGSLHGIQQSQAARDGDWVHLRFDDSPRSQQRRLASKLKRENEQLSGVTDPRLIILDVSGLGIAILREGEAVVADTLARFDRQHPSVAEIWLLVRVWTEDPARWTYRGLAHVNPNARDRLPADLGALVVFRDRDVLRS